MNFDYATVQTYVSSIFGSNQDIGKGNRGHIGRQNWCRDGKFTVIERKVSGQDPWRNRIFSNSDRGGSQLGGQDPARWLGRWTAIIIGSITEFGRDDKKTNVGGQRDRRTHWAGSESGGVSKTNSKAVVAITRAPDQHGQPRRFSPGVTERGESQRSGTGIARRRRKAAARPGGRGCRYEGQQFRADDPGRKRSTIATRKVATWPAGQKRGAVPVRTVTIRRTGGRCVRPTAH